MSIKNTLKRVALLAAAGGFGLLALGGSTNAAGSIVVSIEPASGSWETNTSPHTLKLYATTSGAATSGLSFTVNLTKLGYVSYVTSGTDFSFTGPASGNTAGSTSVTIFAGFMANEERSGKLFIGDFNVSAGSTAGAASATITNIDALDKDLAPMSGSASNGSYTLTSPPPATCPSGQTGTPPNCVTPTCPSGQTGTPPNCTTPLAATCPSGQTGSPPNCTTPGCPSGQTGTPPNCKAPAAATCPSGQTGTPPNCKAATTTTTTTPPPTQITVPDPSGTPVTITEAEAEQILIDQNPDAVKTPVKVVSSKKFLTPLKIGAAVGTLILLALIAKLALVFRNRKLNYLPTTSTSVVMPPSNTASTYGNLSSGLPPADTIIRPTTGSAGTDSIPKSPPKIM